VGLVDKDRDSWGDAAPDVRAEGQTNGDEFVQHHCLQEHEGVRLQVVA
jgi:hypothetical protein